LLDEQETSIRATIESGKSKNDRFHQEHGWPNFCLIVRRLALQSNAKYSLAEATAMNPRGLFSAITNEARNHEGMEENPPGLGKAS
jgi:hypothetical protein